MLFSFKEFTEEIYNKVFEDLTEEEADNAYIAWYDYLIEEIGDNEPRVYHLKEEQ